MPDGVVKLLWEELKQDGSSLTTKSDAEYHLFCSFDLVNSTALKAKDKAWPIIISSFSDFVTDSIRKRVKHLEPWKFLGDEVVFSQRVYSLNDIHDFLPTVSDVLHRVIEDIYEHFPTCKGLVSVRGTAWGAFCFDGTGDRLNLISKEVAAKTERNIRIGHRKGKTDGLVEVETDFMGPSMDEGFRLQEIAPRGRLAVSAELAYFASLGRGKATKIRKCLRVVGYQKLKGIWSDRLYPVIWYNEDWDTFKTSFCYDERFDNPLIELLLKEKPSPISALHKVFNDLGQIEQFDKEYSLLKTFNAAPPKRSSRFHPPLLNSPAQQVHCVAVCVDGHGRCLIAKRPSTKRLHPNCWEFGCSQLKTGQSFEECLVEAYQDDFGAKLDAASLQPLSTFIINDSPKVPGIIFVGTVSNASAVKPKKHADLRWISSKNLPNYANEACVPQFAETVKIALAQIGTAKKRNNRS